MRTFEISKNEIDSEPLCEGYKAINWDSSAIGNFKYGEFGENLVGKIFKVDGEISECKWGLHFCKDPAHIFNFYKPLGYNRYFKVRAYGTVIHEKDGYKSVAKILEFVEEYNFMQFTDLIKNYDRSVNNSDTIDSSVAVGYSSVVKNSEAINFSASVNWSNAVNMSTAINNSSAVNWSDTIDNSNAINFSNVVNRSEAISYSEAINRSSVISNSIAINSSSAVNWSDAISNSSAVSNSGAVSSSYGLRNCVAVKYGLFCSKIEGAKYVLFNKKCTKERFEEVYKKILSFNWVPQFSNWYDVKGSKEWWAFCFPQLKEIDNNIAWSKMPSEMLEYIKSLPEYNENVFNEITGKWA